MVVTTGVSFEQHHIDRLEAITDELLRQRRIRRRNRSDVLRLLIEDFSLPNWSIDSELQKDQSTSVDSSRS